ncbi:MAG TPA: cation:proton antiporter [Thermodesulfobacteriota bacterium]|nr:cation:proton antiporter [Thermodesulfobacteriota bacterium]
MEIPLLSDIVVIFGLSIAVLFVCHRFRVPTIVGFLLTGVLAGPYGLGLIKGVHQVEILAEIGVVLLLFTIGIEFSLRDLLKIRRSVLLGGSLQVLLTILAVFFIAEVAGFTFGQSIFMGFLISLSSTAIVLKLLQERAEVDSPHGRTALAILIFQDIVVVPMMLLTPLLAGESENISRSLLILLVKGIGIIVLVFISAQWIVPQLLYQIARTRSRELFMLSIVVTCFAVAWLTSSMGLSLALGAFLAGLIISESEYSHQALSNILPFRDIFTSFFFVSIGMLFNLNSLFDQPILIVFIALGVIALKAITASAETVLLGFPLRTSILAGLALSQVGEFSFILSKVGVGHELISQKSYQMFLAVSVLTLVVTPFTISLSHRFADSASNLPILRKLKSGLYTVSEVEDYDKKGHSKDHLIIVGFGVNGRNLTRAAKVAGIPYIIIEMNPETVRGEKAKGEPIYYGDATQEAVLGHAGIKDARVLVIAISDPAATRQITAISRRLNPKVHIIARTRFLREMKPLYELGANEVIPEEFETSIEIFTRVLTKYLIPNDDIERLIAEVRSDSYEMLRSPSASSASFSDLRLSIPDIEISTFRVDEESQIVGESLAQIGLRNMYGVTLLAIRRDSQILSNPSGDTQLCANDVLVVLGSPDKIAGVAGLFRNPDEERISE